MATRSGLVLRVRNCDRPGHRGCQFDDVLDRDFEVGGVRVVAVADLHGDFVDVVPVGVARGLVVGGRSREGQVARVGEHELGCIIPARLARRNRPPQVSLGGILVRRGQGRDHRCVLLYDKRGERRDCWCGRLGMSGDGPSHSEQDGAQRRPQTGGAGADRTGEMCYAGRLGSARLGSARLGSARLGSARLGSARLGSARLGSARLGSARLGSARLGSARLGSARLGEADRL